MFAWNASSQVVLRPTKTKDREVSAQMSGCDCACRFLVPPPTALRARSGAALAGISPTPLPRKGALLTFASNGGILAQMQVGNVYPGAKACPVVLILCSGASDRYSPLRGKGVGEMPVRAAPFLFMRRPAVASCLTPQARPTIPPSGARTDKRQNIIW